MRALPLHAHDSSAAYSTNSIMIGTPIFSRADPRIPPKRGFVRTLILKDITFEF